MKKNKRTLLTILAMISVIAVSGLVCACQPQNLVKYAFETNGADAIAAVEVTEGTNYTLPVPVREGYEFEGWYDNADFRGEPVTSVVAKSNATYYAKWEKLYEIKLELNGGSLNAGKLTLKAGANIYDLMKDYVPEKSGFIFGAWFNGDSELSRNARMPESDVTLTAMFKVAYTVELWEEKLDGEGYEKNENVITQYGYVGASVSYEQSFTGFVLTETDDSVEQLTLSENASENVLKYYLNRERYSVTFRSNYPQDGAADDRVTEEIKYGEEKEIPVVNFKASGYMLAGWAYSVNDAAAYGANLGELNIYNAENEEQEAPKYSVERNTTFYAVWTKGYSDMFGGNDYLFIPDEEGDSVYLVRENIFFKGILNPETKSFRFLDANGDILIQGRLYENNTFAYASAERDGNSSNLFIVGQGLVDTDSIIFDNYNGITYMQETAEGLTSSKGSYTINADGYYVAEFTSGPLSGKTITMVLGTVSMNDGTTRNAFQIRNDAEFELGIMYRGAVYEGQLTYYTQTYQLLFSGFGTAYYNNNGQTTMLYYVENEDGSYTLITSKSQVFGVIRIITVNAQNCYVVYDSTLAVTFTATSGAKLTLDGTYNAVYENGAERLEGYYTLSQAALGNYIVNMTANGKSYKYLASSITSTVDKEVTDDDGNTTTVKEEVTTYVFEEKDALYSEFYFKAASNILYSPLFVITGEGKGSVYYRVEGVYTIVSDGTYAYDEATGRYVYTADKFYTEEAMTVVGETTTEEGTQSISIDLAKIKTFKFSLSVVNNYSVNYWFAFENLTEEETNYEVIYTGKDNAKLSLVTLSAMATYSGEGRVITGTYSIRNGYLVLSVSNGSLYFILDDENMSFTMLSSAPYSSYALAANGSIDRNETLSFDGLGGATYSVVVTDDEGNRETLTYIGTVTLLDKETAFNTPIYKFEAEEMTFEYLALSTSSSNIFAKYNENYHGEYNSETAGMLQIDGFGFTARYTDTLGNVYEGIYSIPRDGVIRLNAENGNFFFDVNENTFTVRGSEYGAYYVLDNWSLRNLILELDGYGNLIVHDMEGNDIGTGTYTVDGDEFTVNYTAGSEQVTLVGCLDSLTLSNNEIPTFVILHEEAVNVYINAKDWSVLILDKMGNAIKYDVNGRRELGNYTLISDSLLYYVNEEGTDATIYEYDVANGAATQKVFNSRGYNYFTESLESLRFTRYGFAIFNNETRYYYNIIGDEVIIYHQDGTNENANEYGFVEEKFGKFDAVKVYDGKTYYFSSTTAVELKRNEESKDKFPVEVTEDNYYPLDLLRFTPTGGDTFAVSGTARVNGTDYNCTVVRRLLEDEVYENYVMIGTYRFYINYAFSGEDEQGKGTGVYEVVDLKSVRTVHSYSYLYMYMIYSMFLGQSAASQLPNTFGTVELVTEFDEAGQMIESYMNGAFGKDSGFVDSNGTIIALDKVPYENNNNIYTVEVIGTDDYTYRLYLSFRQMQGLGYGYQVAAFTRVETLTDGEYTAEVERIIATDGQSAPGAFYTAKLFKNDEEIKCDIILIIDGNLRYVARTYDEQNKIVSTTYYNAVFTEKKGDIIEGEEDGVALFESVKVTSEEMTTMYTEDGKSYVDISANNEIEFVVIDGNAYLPTECTYDEASKTYTMTLSNGSVYTVKVEEELVEITEVKQDVEE